MNKTDLNLTAEEQTTLNWTLWQARESIGMWLDVVEKRTGKIDVHTRHLLKNIDDMRRKYWMQQPDEYRTIGGNPDSHEWVGMDR